MSLRQRRLLEGGLTGFPLSAPPLSSEVDHLPGSLAPDMHVCVRVYVFMHMSYTYSDHCVVGGTFD